MSIETRLHALAYHIRNLLGCGHVALFLGCPDPALRHPLLSSFSSSLKCSTWQCEPLVHVSPFFVERVEALCDMAMQSDRLWCIDQIQLAGEKSWAGSIVAAPLACSAGMLGVVLFCGAGPTAFMRGECSLIVQYLATIAARVEKLLGDHHASPISAFEQQHTCSGVQEQSEFISIVSHELRVPLTAIKGYAVLLQAYGITDKQAGSVSIEMTTARQQQYLDIIIRQTNHLEVLIGDLLDVSRIQAGRLTLRRSRTDIARLCRFVSQIVQYRVDQQHPGLYCIRCSIEPDFPFVWADPDRVQQVLTNLLENAVKYSPGGGLIEVKAYTRRPLYSYEQGDEPHHHTTSLQGSLVACVTVRDSGIGIPRRQQPALFQPFTRLEHPETTRISGIGLGLYISRKLVEAMDGHVLLRSREGKGTSVTFTLPAELATPSRSLSLSDGKSYC